MPSRPMRGPLSIVVAVVVTLTTAALAETARGPGDEEPVEVPAPAAAEGVLVGDPPSAGPVDAVQEPEGGGAEEAPAAQPPSRHPDGRPLDLLPGRRWIYVDKSERLMIVSRPGYRESFRVALGWAEGDKQVEGDGRTPEGEYYVCQRIRSDRFHRFLGLSYPGPEDASRGSLERLLQPVEVRAILRAWRHRTRPPWNTRLGGNVGIHGWGRRREIEPLHALGKDWTDGCLGVTNSEIERIYDRVRLGTRVVIAP